MDAFTTPLLAGTATGALLLIAALGLALTFRSEEHTSEFQSH